VFRSPPLICLGLPNLLVLCRNYGAWLPDRGAALQCPYCTDRRADSAGRGPFAWGRSPCAQPPTRLRRVGISDALAGGDFGDHKRQKELCWARSPDRRGLLSVLGIWISRDFRPELPPPPARLTTLVGCPKVP